MIYILILLSFISFLPPFALSYTLTFKENIDLSDKCRNFQAVMYPYILYSPCQKGQSFFFQKISLFTNSSSWQMSNLFDVVEVAPETQKKQTIQITLLSETYFAITNTSQLSKNKMINIYQINVHKFLFMYPLQSNENTSSKIFPSLFERQAFGNNTKNMIWTSAFNGSTHRLAFLEQATFKTQLQEVQGFNLSIADLGFNSIKQNPFYEVLLSKKSLNLQTINYFNIISADGNFILFLGSQKDIKVFNISLYYMFPLKTISLESIQFFGVLDSSYLIVKEDILYVFKESRQVCSYNVNVSSTYKIINSTYIQACQSNSEQKNCQLITEECSIFHQQSQNKTLGFEVFLKSNESLTFEEEQYLSEKQNERFFTKKQYYNASQFAFLYADYLMKEKIKTFLKKGEQSNEIQECEAELQQLRNQWFPTKIKLSNKDWRVCKIGLEIAVNIIIEGKYQTQPQNPYKLVICKFQSKLDTNKCIYIEDKLKTKKLLMAPNYYRMYIFYEGGEKYDIQLKDLAKEQLENVKNGFFYIMVFVFSILFCMGLRAIIHFLSLYYGWNESEPRYSYPLNTLHLMIKLKRLQNKGYFKYQKFHKQQGDENQVICCFCLQEVMPNEKIIQLYCKHEFHSSCYENWVKNEQFCKCPVCKRGFTEDELAQFQNRSLDLKEIDDNEISDAY